MQQLLENKSIYRGFLPYANFITANFVTAVFQNYYWNLANAILCDIYFVTAYIKIKILRKVIRS